MLSLVNRLERRALGRVGALGGIVLAAGLFGGSASGAPSVTGAGLPVGIHKTGDATTKPAGVRLPDGQSTKALCAARLAAEEGVIGDLIATRSASVSSPANLELGIDMRLLVRQALVQAVAAKPDTDEQAGAFLRAGMLNDAVAAVEMALERRGSTAFDKPRLEAAAALNKLTFSLAEQDAKTSLDEVCKTAALTVVAFVGTEAGDMKNLPTMRPKPKADVAQRDNTGTGDNNPTVVQLGREAGQLTLSAALKEQTAAVAKLAATLATQAGKDKDAAALANVLSQAVDLERGLSANTAVTPEARTQLEGQLTQALALFTDARTRGAGQSRIESLQQYRQLVARVHKLNFKPEKLAQFGPLLAWAEQNKDDGARALGALESYAQSRGKLEALPRPTAAAAFKASIDGLEKQFQSTDTTFCADVTDLLKQPMPMATVTDLEKAAEEMRRQVELLEKIEQLPTAVDVLTAFRPRPSGALEIRVRSAVSTASGVLPTNARGDAVRFINDIQSLAGLANELSQAKPVNVPAAVEKSYAGGQLLAVDAKWKTTMTDLLTAAGSPNSELDKNKVAALATAKDLLLALREAAVVEAALANYGELLRWVDWRLSRDELKLMFAPYALEMSNAFTGYAAGTSGAVDKWNKAQKRYRPIMVLAAGVVAYRDQCAALPTATPGLVAGLMTPMDGAPFSTERFASVAMAMHARCLAADDEDGANDVLALLSARIAKDLKLGQ